MGKITIEVAYNSVVASFWQGQKGVFNDKVLVINKMPLFFLYPFFNAYIHLQCGIKLAHLPVD